MDSIMQTTTTTSPLSAGNVEAMLKLNKVWAEGLQTWSKTLTTATQGHFDDAVSNMRALGGAKSLTEAVQLQANFARTSLEKAVAETGTLTTASFKLAEASMAPLLAWMNFATGHLTH